jgi:methyltransferase OMS1
MASNLALRRVGLATAAIGSYTATVYFTYQFMTSNTEGEDPKSKLISNPCGCSSCYVTDPKRNETYQRIAEAYDEEISREEAAMGMNLLRRALLYFHAAGNVLEVGAGTGRNLSYYPAGVNEITLTDVSDQMLLQARKKVKQLKEDKSRFKLFVADALNMTEYYKEDAFDTVVDTFGLCSFDDPVEVLRELQRVCKPGGKILLLEHGRSKTFEGLNNYLDRNAERHAKNWGCVFNRDIDKLIEESGLKIEKLHRWHFGTTYYIVCRPGSGKYVPRVRKETTLDSTIVSDYEKRNDIATKNESRRLFFIPSWLKREK